jgi:Na+/H+-dicarboxylate symporter
MFRTAVNVAGDAICTIIVAFKNNSMDVDVFKGKKEMNEEDKVLVDEISII